MSARQATLSHHHRKTAIAGLAVCFLLMSLHLGLGSHTAETQSATLPVINAGACLYDPLTRRLVIKGLNFDSQASVVLRDESGPMAHGRVKVKSKKKIVVTGVDHADPSAWIEVTVANPDGGSATERLIPNQASDGLLESDVRTIIAQAVAQAEAAGLRAVIAVTDKEGNVLGIFRMTGARDETLVGIGRSCAPCGLEGRSVPSVFAAISKAGTGTFLSSQGHAFTTRTASFIVQEHFPPRVDFTPGGPLFGVQFSQLLCSDINPRLPLGLSADPGGIPLYKNGRLAGGVGVEGDGIYGLDPDPTDRDTPIEETIALGAARGFEAPPAILADQILVNGIRFPYVNAAAPSALPVAPFDGLPGEVVIIPGLAPGIRAALPSQFRLIDLEGLAGLVDDRFFPFKAGSLLTRNEVQRIIVQAAAQAFITRGAIRQPLNSAAQVNIAVVDVDGTVLGLFSTPDAALFGLDVSVQKARTVAFLSSSSAGAHLRQVEGGRFARFVDAAAQDGLKLDGSVAFSDRAVGFLHRPFFPDGIDGSGNGPFSAPIQEFSPFNVGLQLDLLLTVIDAALNGSLLTPCTAVSSLGNGLQIFPGSVPLYKDGRLAGAIGISGDGVDQDDIIAAFGSAGFESPPEMRTDRIFVRGVRLPFVKFPRHPNR